MIAVISPSSNLIGLLYLVTIICFIFALRFLSSPKHARRGNWIGGVGMILAIASTLLLDGIGNWALIIIAGVIGAGVGLFGARTVKMTAMPQMVALFNGVGGGAAALVALAEFHIATAGLATTASVSTVLSALIGSISFAGSMIAFAKLQELLSGRPITFPGQNIFNIAVLLATIALGVALVAGVHDQWVLWLLVGLALLFGVLFVLPIGGADMPVVISLLNAFTGLAASATGFVLSNTVLIVAGMLVGASGTMLTLLMAKAMNRSITNVLFGAFGQIQSRCRQRDARRRRAHRSRDDARGRCRAALVRPQGRRRARLRHGRGAGPARRPPARRAARGEGRRGEVRHPPRRRPHAGAHERPPRRGERARTTCSRRWTRSIPSSRRPTWPS